MIQTGSLPERNTRWINDQRTKANPTIRRHRQRYPQPKHIPGIAGPWPLPTKRTNLLRPSAGLRRSLTRSTGTLKQGSFLKRRRATNQLRRNNQWKSESEDEYLDTE